MVPSPERVKNLAPSGITTVLENYGRFGPKYGLEFVTDPKIADVVAIHAGMGQPEWNLPTVAHCHGLYWTAFERVAAWEWKANEEVINVIRNADVVTVPSKWVAETFQRDMHYDPVVLPHGVVADEWEAKENEIQYVLWNKNRSGDVCDPFPVTELARRFPNVHFMTTFVREAAAPNVRVTGIMPHEQMKEVIERSYVYLATTKETFGIGTLEAMAAGVPVLAFRRGGNAEIVKHGVNGYLANPYDYDDLEEGLRYCIRHHDVLGANGRKIAKSYSWDNVMSRLRESYELAIGIHRQEPSVAVVVPVYNKEDTVARAVRSAMGQTVSPDEIWIVDNNSTDNSIAEIERVAQEANDRGIRTGILHCEKQGVAYARNFGISAASTKYICCLDADDEIKPEFLEVCINALEDDRSLGLAYTKMEVIDRDGKTHEPDWPGEYVYDDFLARKNPVPTCNVFRRDIALRVGGYRQRYAPNGAGAEDAELWFRMGANGYGGILAGGGRRLFVYHLGGLVSGSRNYSEADWHYWHPWTRDKRHPFASLANTTDGHPSHPVRYYDEPIVSVVIPCTHEHAGYLWNALDSLEAQTFRRWECIVVWDTGIPETDPSHHWHDIKKTWPWVRHLFTNKKGAGAARNAGVRASRAPYILFLDADDWLFPEAIEDLYEMHNTTGNITYSDYYGHSFIDVKEANRLKSAGRIVDYRESDGSAVVYHRSAEFDCERAALQPDTDTGKFYIWNLITSLVPRSWHNDIGGFDTSMKSWEDWDYWLRMARRGYCFTRLPKPLVNYRFYSGSRRETGRQTHTDLVSYLKEKYKGDNPMPCSGCRGGRRRSTVPTPVPTTGRSVAPVAADDTVMVRLIDGNIGEHTISIRGEDNIVRNYGSRKDGDEFLMRDGDAHRYPSKFLILNQTTQPAAIPQVVPPEEPEPLPDPVPAAEIPKTPEPVLIEEEPEKPKTTSRRRTSRRKTSKTS